MTTEPTAETPRRAPGVRARVRAEMTASIKQAARQQLITDGASSLSLRAIARELDMASSAIYRYFASRDELLTALIIDAYEAVARAVETADAQACDVDETDLVERMCAVAAALRTWAFDHPHEYALIFGSPAPGYQAPQDTIDPAARVPLTLIRLIVLAHANQSDDARDTAEPGDPAVAEALAGLDGFTGSLLTTQALTNAVAAWAQLFGTISLELFGHLNNSVAPGGVFFDHAARDLARRVLTPNT